MYYRVTMIRKKDGEIISQSSRTFDERRFEKWVNDTQNKVNAENEFDDMVRELKKEGFVVDRNDGNHQIFMAHGSESVVVSLYEYD